MKNKKLAEPWLLLNGKKIYGEDITKHHREWKTSSYHCVKCGAPINIIDFDVCWNCKEELNEN